MVKLLKKICIENESDIISDNELKNIVAGLYNGDPCCCSCSIVIDYVYYKDIRSIVSCDHEPNSCGRLTEELRSQNAWVGDGGTLEYLSCS